MDRRDRMAMFGKFDGRLQFNEQKMVFEIAQEDYRGICDEMDERLPEAQKVERAVLKEEESFELPARWEVCGTCEGKGTHVNPSIDADCGITAEEFERDWSLEEREAYFTGGYDIQCSECGGKRVSPVVDESRCDPHQRAVFSHLDDEHERSIIERESEMRWQF